jgi:hypothetical protein
VLESLGEDDEGAVDEILVARAGVVVRPLSRRRLGARTRGFPAGIRTLLRLGWGIVFIPFGDGGFLQGFNRVGFNRVVVHGRRSLHGVWCLLRLHGGRRRVFLAHLAPNQASVTPRLGKFRFWLPNKRGTFSRRGAFAITIVFILHICLCVHLWKIHPDYDCP